MEAKFFKVTTVQYYVIDYKDKKNKKADISLINGWTTDEIKKDWFEDFPLTQSHATRDSHSIGNLIEIKSIEVVDDISNEEM